MPDVAVRITLFVLGTAIGSFINVLALRYSEKNGFKRAMRGRSKCPHCSKTLKWYELIPIVSFLIQLGKCRGCGKGISLMYPAVELAAGLIALYVPLQLGYGVAACIWAVALWTLLLMSFIDLRLKLIPNGLVVLLTTLGSGLFLYRYSTGYFSDYVGSKGISFIGHYYLTFRVGSEALVNYLWAVAFGLVLFGGIYLLSKGKAMGLGDVKLAGALGTLLVFPDMVAAMALSFIVGAAVGLVLMKWKGMSFKSSVPFGPFMALGVTLVFFFGYDIVNAYFKLFGLV